MQRKGHELASATRVERALAALGKPSQPNMDRLTACQTAIGKRLAADLEQVQSLMAAGKSHEAWKSLLKIDARYPWRCPIACSSRTKSAITADASRMV